MAAKGSGHEPRQKICPKFACIYKNYQKQKNHTPIYGDIKSIENRTVLLFYTIHDASFFAFNYQI